MLTDEQILAALKKYRKFFVTWTSNKDKLIIAREIETAAMNAKCRWTYILDSTYKLECAGVMLRTMSIGDHKYCQNCGGEVEVTR